MSGETLRALSEAATPGPWKTAHLIGRVVITHEDADLIAAAVNHVRALLAAASTPAPGDEGLRAENDAARRMLADERAAVSALEGRLDKIAEWHHKEVDEQGGTYGSCFECGMPWPCATSRWATDDTAEANCTWELDDCAFPEHNNHTIRAALSPAPEQS